MQDSDYEFDENDVEKWEQEKKALLENNSNKSDAENQLGISASDTSDGFQSGEKESWKEKAEK